MPLWGIHNALKGWTLYGLTAAEVQLLVQVMSANEIRLCKVCTEGATTWSSLSNQEQPQLFWTKQTSAQNFPALHQTEKTLAGEIDTEYFVVRPRKQLPRLHKRHDVGVPCTLSSTTKSIGTTTVNLSEGGLQFTDTLPDWIAGYFIVALSLPIGVVQLMCSIVEDQKEKKRVQVVSEDTDPQFIVYRDWLSQLK